MKPFIAIILFMACAGPFTFCRDALAQATQQPVGREAAGAEQHAAGNAPAQDGYTDPKKPIEVKAGQEFTIVLGAVRSVGYRWELARQPEKAVVELVRSGHPVPDRGKTGAGDKEAWTFRAVSAGATKVAMKYVRQSGQKRTDAKIVTFDVLVKE